MFSKKIICILGPTCTGKTDLSIYISKKFDTEIISVDAYTIYKDMNIGTDKISLCKSKNRAKHHYIDILLPTDAHSVYNFYRKSYKILKYCWENDKLPVFVGGNLMYMWVLQKQIKKNHKYGVSPAFLNIGILPLNKIIFTKNIENRLKKMFANGFIKEVESLKNKYKEIGKKNSMKAIGYKEINLYLENKISKEFVFHKIVRSTLNLANKQILWLKKWDNMFYFNLIDKNNKKLIYNLIKNYLNKKELINDY